MYLSEEDIMDIFEIFYNNKNEEQAELMAKYMKNLFLFLGLKKPGRSVLSKELLKEKKKDSRSYRLVAYLRIMIKGVAFDQVSIGRVIVDKENRCKGIARDMMGKAIEFIEKQLNEKEIKLSAQEYLINFYESVGFKVVSEMYLEDGIPHVEMLYKS